MERVNDTETTASKAPVKIPPEVKQRRRRYRLLYKLEAGLETPMFLLAIVWLVFLIIEFVQGLTEVQQQIVTAIWIIFILEYLLKLFLAQNKWAYIRNNLITLVALIIPAFRAFRLVRAIRILRATRVASTTNFVRALTSGKRFWSALETAQGPDPTPEMNVGMLLSHSPAANKEELLAFAQQLADDTREEMEKATNLQWFFHIVEPERLNSDNPRRPTDFMDEATLRMGEGPYDLIVVVTDVALVSRRKRVEPGLVSAVSRIMVLSTRKLVTASRGKPMRTLDSPAARWNGAALFLHMLGHIIGLDHKDRLESRMMAPFEFKEDRVGLPRFTEKERKNMRKKTQHLPERELRGGNIMETFVFHVLMAFRHPGDVLRPLLRNWSFFLALSLPGLATAALAPCFLLVFTAEIWDVGLGLENYIAVMYAIISILGASFYLVKVQSLFMPRKEKRILTEHLAVANTVVYLSILFACIGLFTLLGVFMFLMEILVFPPDLMQTWPTVEQTEGITLGDKIRLAAFISTVGVSTGALAGGIDTETIVERMAFFQDEP
ncbi:hypothetical protein CLV24_11630 [Pontibacter ummariensis]|uniref:Uncharacterized protein n=1 Tax=Pontibacter ummariensis TaxID=1610492 RepID=A0A239IA99_9BACT|nr:hypothetical protein [Pontibacter ummariensis]PRY09962.1 hypothetical protein CLV24_11630 [Pontibacter ummariensis]SNS90461.1 hypothetical protein SAMN06296052_11669 [Pontibacter ummariensis]